MNIYSFYVLVVIIVIMIALTNYLPLSGTHADGLFN